MCKDFNDAETNISNDTIPANNGDHALTLLLSLLSGGDHALTLLLLSLLNGRKLPLEEAFGLEAFDLKDEPLPVENETPTAPAAQDDEKFDDGYSFHFDGDNWIPDTVSQRLEGLIHETEPSEELASVL